MKRSDIGYCPDRFYLESSNEKKDVESVSKSGCSTVNRMKFTMYPALPPSCKFYVSHKPGIVV